jgi:predicted RNA-binding protein YlqC (UPF0109 family)
MDRLRDITDAVRTNVQLMVDCPEEVMVECLPAEGGASIRIAVASTDLGKIIGKQGRHARALRVLASAMGMAAKQKISLNIDECRICDDIAVENCAITEGTGISSV